MIDLADRRTWIEAAGFAAIATLFYQSPVLVMAFLIPLELLMLRRGEEWYAIACGITLVLVLATKLIQFSRVQGLELSAGLMLLELFMPVLFMGGLYVLSTPRLDGYRRLYRFLAVAVTAGIVSIPVVIYLGQSDLFTQALQAQLQHAEQIVAQSSGAATGDSVPAPPEAMQQLLRMATQLILSSYVFGFAVVLAGNWYAARLLATRFFRKNVSVPRLERFVLPPWAVWALLVPWAGVLLDAVSGLGVFRYPVWNAALVMLFLYGMQGIGILWHVLDKYNMSRGVRMFIGVGLIILILVPGLNVLVAVGIPGLGVSEIWINYNRFERR